MGRLRTLGLAIVLLISGGCGTLINLSGGLPDSCTVYPYGGTLVDGAGVVGSVNMLYELGTGQAVTDNGIMIPLGVLAAVDLPFSILADTLTLPWTVQGFVHLDQLLPNHRTAADEESGKPE